MSKKDYKKGMADAMEAYEAFGEKQENAIRHVGQEVEKTAQKVDKLGGKIGEISDYITDQEKAALYKLNTPVDIADLEDAEKRILLAVLYQLSADADEVTEEQQNYLRAVQQYLKIYNPQTEIDLSAVENIEDISAQKAVLQAVLEFFRLGAAPEELTEEQEDFLDYFQVNRRTRREIDGFIDAIVEAVGMKGLAEKYGFVAEQPKSEFAKYQDNGRIPEKVADLCLSLIRQGYDRFQNDEYVLETKDYLVMCKNAYGAGINAQKYWEDTEKKGELAQYGLFRIDKSSGAVTRIAIDYKNDFPFYRADNLSFCIRGNTIYFIENDVNRDNFSEVPLVAIDFEKQSFRQILKLPNRTYQDMRRFHITCNKTYVMVYAYCISPYASPTEDMVKKMNQAFVIDLTQENRTFVLQPDLTVRDAFIYDDKFCFLGKLKNSSSYMISLFQYDIASSTATDILEEYHNSGLGIMLGLASLGNWVDQYSKNYIIESIFQAEGHWYFQCRVETNAQFEMSRKLCTPKESKPGDGYYLKDFLSVESAPIIFSDGSAIGWWKSKDKPGYYLTRCNLLTGEKTYPDKGADIYILLGDYLYKRCGGEWYRTNTSLGWDNLQWEYLVS